MFTVVLTLALGTTAASEPAPEILARGRNSRSSGARAFTEGGALAGDGSILFSDIGDRIMRFDPKTGRRHRLPRAERPGQRPDLRPQGTADRRRGGEHRRRPAGLDHRARRHGPHAGRPLSGQAIQQPQRRRRRSPGAGLRLRPTLRRRRAARARLRGASSGSTPTARSTAWRRRPRSPTAWRSAPTARRSTSPTAARSAGRCSRSTSTPTASVARPRVLHDFGDGRGIDGMTVTTDGRIVAAAGSRRQGRRLRLLPRRQAARIPARTRVPHQRRVRRPRPQDPLHHGRQEPLIESRPSSWATTSGPHASDK